MRKYFLNGIVNLKINVKPKRNAKMTDEQNISEAQTEVPQAVIEVPDPAPFLSESPVVLPAGADVTDSTEAAQGDVAEAMVENPTIAPVENQAQSSGDGSAGTVDEAINPSVSEKSFGTRLAEYAHDAEGKAIRTAEEIFHWCKENI